MSRFGKNKTVIYALLAVVALQFIGLTGLLASGEGASAQETPPPVQESPLPSEDEIPEWLRTDEPVEEPEEGATPEPVAEKEPPEDALSAADILPNTQIVAHGLGAVGETTVLNCREGFLAKYEQGVRVFEADLRLTRDLQVVLRHDWRAGWQEDVGETAIPTLEEFLAQPLEGKYTPLSFRDLLKLMEEYPDICIVTDSKYAEAEMVTLQFEAMVADAQALGLSYLFDRMAIQIYSPLMFQVVDSIHHFPNYIYTLYAQGFTGTEEAFLEQADFCKTNGILGITMWDYLWREEFASAARERDILVFTHTVNDPQEARDLLAAGVSAVYTDHLIPSDLEDPAAAEPDEMSAPAQPEEEQSEEREREKNGVDRENTVQ